MVPRSVAALAASGEWDVQYSLPSGRWLTAERVVVRGGRRWRLGLTPVSAAIVALVVWLDEDVVAHVRGTEAQVCAQAHLQVLEVLGRL